MKTELKKTKDKKTLREDIVTSAIASFQIEGITISKEEAMQTLKKIELILEK